MEVTTQSGAGQWRAGWERQVRLYTSLVALVLGLPLNVLVLALLRGAYFRRTSTGLLLVIITLCDLAFLLTDALRWLILAVTDHDLDIAAQGLPGCMLFQQLKHVFDHLSIWLLILVILERVVTIWRTLFSLCILKHLHCLTLTLGLVTLLFNVHWYWNIADMNKHLDPSEHDGPFCPLPAYPYLPHTWFWADLMYGSVVPLFLLLLVTSVLIANIGLAVAQKRSVIHSSSSHNFTNFERLMTAVSSGLSALCLAANLPSLIYLLGDIAGVWRHLGIWTVCYSIKYLYSSLKLPVFVLIVRHVSPSALTPLLCCIPPEAAKQSTDEAYSGNDESDQHASKGLSSSAQGSLRTKGEKLRELLSYLERGPVEQLGSIISMMQSLEARADTHNPPIQAKSSLVSNGPDGTEEKPRKKRLSSRQRKLKGLKSVDGDLDQGDDESLDCAGSGVVSRASSIKRPLAPVVSVPLEAENQERQEQEKENGLGESKGAVNKT